MKLPQETRNTLIAILNAQSGIKRLRPYEYKQALIAAAPYLNKKDGKFTGGITREIYEDNKDDKDLIGAHSAHIDKAEKIAAPSEKNEVEVTTPGPRIKLQLNDKIRVSDAILGKGKRVDPEVYSAYVPEHVTKKGEVIDKELSGKETLEEIHQWCEENITNGAPCGGGHYEIYEGRIYNDDTEAGHELSVVVTREDDGINIKVDQETPKKFDFPIKASELLRMIDPELSKLLTYKGAALEIHSYKIKYKERHILSKSEASYLYGENIWLTFGEAPKELEKFRNTEPANPSSLLLSAVQDTRNTEIARKLIKLVPEGEIEEGTSNFCAQYNPEFLVELLESRPDAAPKEYLLSSLAQHPKKGSLDAFKAIVKMLGIPNKHQTTNLLYLSSDPYETYYADSDERWKAAREIAVLRQNMGKYLLELGADPKEAMKTGIRSDEWGETDDLGDHDFDGHYEEFLQDMINISEGKPAKEFPPYKFDKEHQVEQPTHKSSKLSGIVEIEM